ncbi:hypothetical protein [Streptomyces sp. NBC_00083]|uniref:hypothetical protein n=1 Tax=Streptomyces sp. NBC_00083 TaxID=2975647 RepID=UPI00224E3066|nr:hypothetical protein [Streptomyces sp. NBC_00083]MCX5384721.1 hypothetical protein [Streptomyces sp. NBC_00083]
MPRIATVTSSRKVRRLTTIAFFGPPVILGLSLLAADPDWSGLALALGTCALIATLFLMITAAPNGWLIVGSVILGIAALSLPGPLLEAEVMAHQGQRAEVRVTSVKRYQAKHGPEYTCRLERVDGKPLNHAELGNDSCDGPMDVGQTKDVLTDPHGWMAPELTETDYSGIDIAAWALPVVVGLFELLVWLSRRVGLRRFEGR